MKIYEGPSRFKGSDKTIQGILTGYQSGNASRNSKTGPVVQLHILVADEHPVTAQKSGSDQAICGTCTERHAVGGSCYVSVARGEASTWRTHKGQSATFNAVDIMSRVGLRLGAYGDPAMLPEKVIRRLCAVANKFRPNHTGFTQRWRLKSNQWLRFFCMASVSSAKDAQKAHALGWRTFRVRSQDEPLEPHEITCPASKEAGRRTTCQRCTLCDGKRTDADQRKNITILYH